MKDNIESINDLGRVVDFLKRSGKKFILRGQTKDKTLKPQIARVNYLLLDNEIEIFEEFKKETARFLSCREEISIPKNDFEWFVWAQHYGLLTRCLDWTYFHGVALFFAVNNDMDNDGVIWIYELPPNESDEWLPLIHGSITEKQIFEFTKIKIYHPKSFLDPRTDNQGSVVTICPYPWQPIEELVDNKRLTKILVPKDFKQGIRTTLDQQHNLNEESLFSRENQAKEIESICKAINFKYVGLREGIYVN